MLDVAQFFNASATDQWFTMPSRKKGSLNDQLEARGFTLIDQPTLESDYKSLRAPVNTVDLSYAPSVPTPISGYKCTFVVGHAYELKKRQFKDRMLSDVMTEWLNTTLGDEKYVMSLFPDTYFLAKTASIDHEDVFNITRGWGIDCCIGIFDKSSKAMFVFAEEYTVTHVSFAPDNVPPEFAEVSAQFESADFVKEITGRGAKIERVEEYYEVVVKPFIP